MSSIWFSVNFDTQPLFANIAPCIVTKNGHHIRDIKNAKSLPQVTVVANASVRELRTLHIDPTTSIMQHLRAYEIVHRNNTSLQSLHLFAITFFSNKQDSLAHYVSAPALAPSSGGTLSNPSKLTTLRVERMCLTYDNLTIILKACPKLTKLILPHTDVVGTSTQSFQHTGVTSFSSNLEKIFDVTRAGPSLLSYFPNLITLSTFAFSPDSTISPTRIKEDINRYCTRLTGYQLVDKTGAIVPDFLTTIADNVSEICFLYPNISLETITAILLHQATLKTVQHFFLDNDFSFEQEEVFSVSDHFQASGQYIQLIPRCCPLLERLNIHGHEMDIDLLEPGKWICRDLKELRIRIKGLDTKEKILRAIALWRMGCRRRLQKKSGISVTAEEQEEIDRSIEARVARHLLKFDKLSEVWLGYQTWTPI